MNRLGNHLFQIASTIGIAIRNGFDYKFPHWEFSDRFRHPIPQGEIYYDKVYKHDYANHFHYKDVIVEDNTSIWGYFHSEKYFTHCAELIRLYFTPADDIKERIEDKYNYLFDIVPSTPLREQSDTERSAKFPSTPLRELLAVSVRRGDYLKHEDFPVMSSEYFNSAIKEYFDSAKDMTVVIFSDDIDWCKENIKGYKSIVYVEDYDDTELYSRFGKAFTDLFLMAMCDHYIISPSTFSWWGAWLSQNRNAKVITPKKWFYGSRADRNISDLCPEHWISHDNKREVK